MFYDNFLIDKKVKYKKIKQRGLLEYNSNVDENLLSLDTGSLAYNFDHSDKSLRDGMGIGELKFRVDDATNKFKTLVLPSNKVVAGVWLFNIWESEYNDYSPIVIIYCLTGEIYYNRLFQENNMFTQVEGLSFSDIPLVTSYRNNNKETIIFVSKSDGMYTWTFPNYIKKIDDVPAISSMCIHEDRLFVTTYGERSCVYFSDDLNPTNFNISYSEGGVIKISDDFGKCNKVISFKGYLYVIRDFNIAKVVSYDDPNEYVVTQLQLSNSRIFEDTIAVCGDEIYYLSTDGLYSFNGTTSKKIDLKIDGMFDGVGQYNAKGVYLNGYYYLACNLNYKNNYVSEEVDESEFTNNALIKINVSSGDFTVMRGQNIVNMFVINHLIKSEVCVITKLKGVRYVGVLDMSGEFYGVPSIKYWRTGNTDLGYPSKKKVIKTISLETQKDIELKIFVDSDVYTFDIRGMSGFQTIYPKVSGKRIALEFISNDAGNYISDPQIMVGVYD